MKIQIVFVLIMGCGWFACLNENSILSNKQADQVTSEVKGMLEAYLQAVNQNGLLAEFAFLDSTDQFSWFPPGFDGPISYDSVAAILKRTAGMYTSIHSEWDTLSIAPATKNSAIYMGEMTSVMTDTAGRVLNFRFKEEGSVIKREDGWKLLNGKSVLKDM